MILLLWLFYVTGCNEEYGPSIYLLFSETICVLQWKGWSIYNNQSIRTYSFLVVFGHLNICNPYLYSNIYMSFIAFFANKSHRKSNISQIKSFSRWHVAILLIKMFRKSAEWIFAGSKHYIHDASREMLFQIIIFFIQWWK